MSDQSPGPPTYLPAVSVAIFHDGAFLLVRRGREPSKGLYAFPGGRVEPGESDEDAVRRELAEETGLTIAALHRAGRAAAAGRRALSGISPAGVSRLRPAARLRRATMPTRSAGSASTTMQQLPVIPSVLEAAQAIIAAEQRGDDAEG